MKRPLALPELATVKENNDDKGQGRVKVAFDWQKNGKTTNWIRVQTPNAGVSGAVPKNRGWVFVPEVGDQVMGYEHGNPDRPMLRDRCSIPVQVKEGQGQQGQEHYHTQRQCHRFR